MTLVLKLSVAALLFAMGLHASGGQLVALWRKPALLIESLLAMYVVVPLLAVLVALVFDLPRGTETAIVVLAVCAGAPLLPRKLLKLGGDPGYVLSLAVTTSLLAIITVPLSLRALSGVLPFDTALSPAPVAWAILKSFFVPFGAGMFVRAFMPRVADRAAEPLLKVAGMVLAISTLAMLVAGWRLVAGVGLPSFLTFAGFVAGCLATGHLLGGLSRRTGPRWPSAVPRATSGWPCLSAPASGARPRSHSSQATSSRRPSCASRTSDGGERCTRPENSGGANARRLYAECAT